jgi:hypothetical protein
MFALRHSLILLLMVLLLPWGAFVAAAQSTGLTGVSVEDGADPVETVAPLKGKCRTGVLPGSSCGSVYMDGSLVTVPVLTSVAGISLRKEGVQLAGYGPAPPTGPPRLS